MCNVSFLTSIIRILNMILNYDWYYVLCLNDNNNNNNNNNVKNIITSFTNYLK